MIQIFNLFFTKIIFEHSLIICVKIDNIIHIDNINIYHKLLFIINMADLYNILGVSKQATSSEITTSYRHLAKIYHPDKSTGNQDKFKEISHAYAILTDDVKRRIYDLNGIEGIEMNERYKSHTRDNVFYEQSIKVPHNNTLFNNIFEQCFNNTETCDISVAPLIHNLDVEIKDIYNGCLKRITYYRNLICQSCYGKGYKPLQIKCEHCSHESAPYCDMCQSKGTCREKCTQCQGNKVISSENTIEVNIKRGMNDKFKINFENLGNEEPNKTTGDLIIQLSIINHSLFEIDVNNLKYHQNISLSEALNGVSREIVFIDGNTILLTTPSGQIVSTTDPLIYKGSGLPIYNEKSYGDLYVYYNIVLPKKIPFNIKKQVSTLIPH